MDTVRTQSPLVSRLLEKFNAMYGKNPVVVRSPGRVNFIGEHTDYNEGFVMPGAIDKAVYVAAERRTDDELHFFSNEFNESFDTRLADIRPLKGQWATYLMGVVHQLQKAGYAVGGFNLVVDGDVPFGAGLSSSAALECATFFALNEVFGLNVPKLRMVQLGQKVEHEWAGVRSGIMDQLASMFGKKDHVIQLDCRSLEYEYEPLKPEGIKVMLFNTNVKHSLASSEYNTRRQQCEEGVALVKAHHPKVTSLRDVTVEMLDKYVKPKDETIYRRCRYVVEEIQRLLAASKDLENGNIEAMGQKMFRTHEGLSKEYEVSCKELDYLVDYVRGNEAVLGARMMGGGFGGCTINLIKEEGVEELVKKISEAYAKDMRRELTVYEVKIEDGTSVIQL